MVFQPLNIVIRAENLVGIYRNYCMVSYCRQKVVFACTLFRLLLLIINIIIRVNYHRFHLKPDVLYYYLATGNSIVLIIISLFHSKEFQKLVSNFDNYYKYFRVDIEYLKKIEQKQKRVVSAVLIIAMIKIVTFTYQRVHNESDMTEISVIWLHFVHINLLFCDVRYIIEYYVVYFVMCLLSEQLDTITRSVENELRVSAASTQESSIVQLTLEHREARTIFDKWSAAYVNVKESLNLCNNIFGVQVTVMLATMIFYYIILLYSVTTMSVKGNISILKQILHYLSLGVFLIALIMLSRGAQSAENSAIKLKRKLCLLLLSSLEDEARIKVTKDLLRLVSSRPIHTQAFGSINLNMTLVPSCVVCFISYTVIALQFNNVL